MKPISEVLSAIQDENKRNQLKKLFEDFEQQKVLYAEPLGKMKEHQEQRAKCLREIEENKQKIQDIKDKNKTEIDALNEDLDYAEDIDDKSEIKRIKALIITKSEGQTKLLERNAELEKLAREAEQNSNNTKMALTSYFTQKRKIQEELKVLGLETKYNIDNIDSSSLKIMPVQTPVTPVVESQKDKRKKPSWEIDKENVKQQRTNTELETSDKKINLIQTNEDKMFISQWWSDKGYSVTPKPDKVEIKNPISNIEIVITDKVASTTSRDKKDLQLMTQQLVDQLYQKGQLSTANFKGKGPEAVTLDRLFKQLKEEKLNQKSELTTDNQSTKSEKDQNTARARIGSMGGYH